MLYTYALLTKPRNLEDRTNKLRSDQICPESFAWYIRALDKREYLMIMRDKFC